MIGNYFDIISIIPFSFGLICLISYFLKKEIVDPRKLAYGATSTGVLLTFYGIWIGLIGFDVTDTEGSIPALLEGLKTAFGSSIVGLFTSLFINLIFVDSSDPEEKSLDSIEEGISQLKDSLDNFTVKLTESNIEALGKAVEDLVSGLEMGINTETKDTIGKFKKSVETLKDWQEKYMDEIIAVTDAMDKNAVVTQATTEHLTRTNEVLGELKPVTETIAESIGWVQSALPSFRKRASVRNTGIEKEISNELEEDKKSDK